MGGACWDFWRDSRSGALWGVVTDGQGDVVACCGPLRPSQANPALLPYLRYSRRDVDWLESDRDHFVPVGTAPYAYAS